ncbi:MarR family winged helix-turn-helix transcriptional regulator [Nocardia transvalensis]|uniref:MarR family winged helix-turn-helix transcriptional regulator n=1 Tax=Nocardia transvalensis TaxID=37333 RepID=UPI001894138C|nr:MarR family transcriptional regulator [Nocardia transvalensis]MBF6332988.1 MarR family transcriptional regulator [Nocardia transvalensis]
MSEKDEAGDEPDLAALMASVFPQLAALEEPILREAGLSMWEYAIMTELASAEGVSQVELSRRTRRDPTRLGKHLNDLTARGLVARARASDQRQRTVRLTDSGRVLYVKVKKRIRVVEDEFLHSTLSTGEAASLRRLLARLAALGVP